MYIESLRISCSHPFSHHTWNKSLSPSWNLHGPLWSGLHQMYLPLLLLLNLFQPHWPSYCSWKTLPHLTLGPLYLLFLKPERYLHQNITWLVYSFLVSRQMWLLRKTLSWPLCLKFPLQPHCTPLLCSVFLHKSNTPWNYTVSFTDRLIFH